MNEVLLTAGAGCVIIAVVGGGAKAFGIDIPVIENPRRQIALFVVGIAFLVGAVALDNAGGDPVGDDAEAKAYRQEVRATCSVLSRQQFPPQNSDRSYDRDAVIRWFKQRLIPSWRSVASELWKRPTPDRLEDEAKRARGSADAYFININEVANRLGAELPARFDQTRLQAFFSDLYAEVATASGRFESAMRVLADERCIRPA